MLRDFRLAGVALDDDNKRRYADIAQRLSELSTTFQQNVLDATQAWRKHITDEARLSGLPRSARSLLAQNASNKDLDGWLVTLDAPSFIAIMTHADDRELRAEVYEMFNPAKNPEVIPGDGKGKFTPTNLESPLRNSNRINNIKCICVYTSAHIT